MFVTGVFALGQPFLELLDVLLVREDNPSLINVQSLLVFDYDMHVFGENHLILHSHDLLFSHYLVILSLLLSIQGFQITLPQLLLTILLVALSVMRRNLRYLERGLQTIID